MKVFWTVIFLASGISASGQNPADSQPGSLAYVFDPGQKSVTAIDLSSGKVTATASVDGGQDAGRDRLEITPDGSRLVVLMDGVREKNSYHGAIPALASKATIIDAKTMNPLPPIDMGRHLGNFFITPDSKVLILVSIGFNPSEISTVNLSNGQLIKTSSIPRVVTGYLVSKDGKTVVLYYEKSKLKGGHYSDAELQFFSVEKQTIVGTVTLDGDPKMPFFSPSGDFIYLLERGRPSRDPRNNFNGKIQVVSLKYMGVAATLDAGSNPRIALPDDGAGQTLILSDGQPVPRLNQIVDAELRVLDGASIKGTLSVGFGPQYLSFSPDRKRLYVTSTFSRSKIQGVVGYNDFESQFSGNQYLAYQSAFTFQVFDKLTVIDYPSIKVLGQIPLDGIVSGVAFTPDGSHGFVLDPKSSKMLTLDLLTMKPGTVTSTGRNGIKVAHFVMSSVEATATMIIPLASVAFSAGNSLLFSPASSNMSVRPDGAYIYVLNQVTNDVTAINTKDTSIAAKIAAGGNRLQPLEGGGVLAVIGYDSITRIDTSTQKALPGIHFEDKLNTLLFSPDNRTIVALTNKTVTLLDGKSGEIQKQVGGFKEPQIVIFAPSEHVGDSSFHVTMPDTQRK